MRRGWYIRTPIIHLRTPKRELATLAGAALSYVSRGDGLSQKYVALSEMVEKVMFLLQVYHFVLPEMGKYSVPMKKDNQQAIKLANNRFISQRTRYVCIKRFIRDAVLVVRVHVVYVASEDHYTSVLNEIQKGIKQRMTWESFL